MSDNALRAAGLIALSCAILGMAHCHAEESRAKGLVQSECIKARGEWNTFWGGYCKLPKQ